MPMILLAYLSSCTTYKQLQYLQGDIDSTKYSQFKVPEQRIQKGDQISIAVFSDNAAASSMFNTILRSAADYELMLRFLLKHEINLSYIPQTIINMRQGGKSTASISNRIKANVEDRKAWRMNGLKPHFFTLILKPLRKIKQFISHG